MKEDKAVDRREGGKDGKTNLVVALDRFAMHDHDVPMFHGDFQNDFVRLRQLLNREALPLELRPKFHQ